MKKNTLVIRNLHAHTTNRKKILNGVNLVIGAGEVHAVMGPNGSGKSTLAQVLMGSPGYTISKGSILMNNKEITDLAPNERAKKGLFLAFQYPVEVAGVNFAGFLRMAINAGKKEKVSPITLRNLISEKAKELRFADDLSARSLNEGFSGGEKKKSEVLQLTILKPKIAILDEPDSGLDVDALKYITSTLNNLDHKPGILLITHYQRILNYIKPDKVHIFVDGKIVKSGDAKLALEVEKNGYETFSKALSK